MAYLSPDSEQTEFESEDLILTSNPMLVNSEPVFSCLKWKERKIISSENKNETTETMWGFFPRASEVKNLPANTRDMFNPCQEEPLENGNGNQLQYFCLENSMDRGTW